jgi:hypothetical protein
MKKSLLVLFALLLTSSVLGGSPAVSPPSAPVIRLLFDVPSIDWQKTMDQRISLEANDLYYGSKPRIREFQFLTVVDDETALRLFEKGMLDVDYQPSSSQLEALRGRRELRVCRKACCESCLSPTPCSGPVRIFFRSLHSRQGSARAAAVGVEFCFQGRVGMVF